MALSSSLPNAHAFPPGMHFPFMHANIITNHPLQVQASGSNLCKTFTSVKPLVNQLQLLSLDTSDESFS
jgi:hypothetical protein